MTNEFNMLSAKSVSKFDDAISSKSGISVATKKHSSAQRLDSVVTDRVKKTQSNGSRSNRSGSRSNKS